MFWTQWDCLLHNLCSSVMLRSEKQTDFRARSHWTQSWFWVRSHLSISNFPSNSIMKSSCFRPKFVDFPVNPWVKSSDFTDFINPQLNFQISIGQSTDFAEIPWKFYLENGSDHHSLYSFRPISSNCQFLYQQLESFIYYFLHQLSSRLVRGHWQQNIHLNWCCSIFFYSLPFFDCLSTDRKYFDWLKRQNRYSYVGDFGSGLITVPSITEEGHSFLMGLLITHPDMPILIFHQFTMLYFSSAVKQYEIVFGTGMFICKDAIQTLISHQVNGLISCQSNLGHG